MSYESLVKSGLIKPFKSARKQAGDRVKLAERDIKAAQAMLAQDRDRAFVIAYNAVLQAARALMFFKGYRPAGGEGQHVAAMRFAEIALGETFKGEIRIFNKMRSKRHRIIYDLSGAISKSEAKQASEFTIRFVDIVKTQIMSK